jgi:hypothetical protein
MNLINILKSQEAQNLTIPWMEEKILQGFRGI